MNTLSKLAAIFAVVILAGCGPQGMGSFAVTQLPQQQGQQPQMAGQYPTAQVMYQPAQNLAQQQPGQPIYVMYNPQAPQQAMQIPVQMPMVPQGQPVQMQQEPQVAQASLPIQELGRQQLKPFLQSIGLKTVEPKHVTEVAGCSLFEVVLDSGPTVLAKCKSFEGPIIMQVSQATLSAENLALGEKAKLIFNNRDKRGTPKAGTLGLEDSDYETNQ